MDGKLRYGQVQEASASSATLTEYSSHWNDDTTKRDDADLKNNNTGTPPQDWRKSVERNAQVARQSTSSYWQQTAWPKIKSIRFSKQHTVAFMLLWICAIGPFIFLGKVAGRDVFFSGVFTSKTIPCGHAISQPVNSTIGGIEGLFVLDATTGQFPFSTVKVIDVTWDVMVGRGAQLLAWWISYKVFSDALLRVIERHPTSYQVFFQICLTGPSFGGLWTMLKDLGRTKSKRTWALYFYMVLSIIYVVTLPIMLSAMTGYTNNAVAWVDIDDSNEIKPASSFVISYVVFGTGNSTHNDTFSTPKCLAPQERAKYSTFKVEMESDCDCRLDNGTITTQQEWFRWRSSQILTNSSARYEVFKCDYKYPGQNGTFKMPGGDIQQCSRIYNVQLDGKDYDASTLNYTSGYCYDNKRAYEMSDFTGKIRCLPDTQNPSFGWGFSSMLSGVFVIANLIWALTIYAVWLDAQFNSKLVKQGYVMTPLRAAFALATVARRKMGCGNVDLVRADTKGVESELFGKSSKKVRHRGAEVDYAVFQGDGKEGVEMMSDAERGLRQRKNGASAFDT